MKINVLGVNHLLITDAICDQVVERFQKIEKFFAPISSVDVHLECKHKHEMLASAHVVLPHKELHASVTEEDMYKAISALAKKIEQQAKKYHDESHHNNHD